MEDIILENRANLVGSYGGQDLELNSEVVSTTIVNGLVMTKEANKQYWIEGKLSYLVTITNNASQDYVEPIFTDSIDASKVALVLDSVRVNEEVVEFTYEENVLAISLETIAVGSTVVVAFDVEHRID